MTVRSSQPVREKREGARRRSGTLHLAQALSNRGRRGRKKDFRDAERLVKRLVARELTLSFVPDAEQRGGSSGRGTYQVVQLGLGSARRQRPAHVEGAG